MFLIACRFLRFFSWKTGAPLLQGGLKPLNCSAPEQQLIGSSGFHFSCDFHIQKLASVAFDEICNYGLWFYFQAKLN